MLIFDSVHTQHVDDVDSTPPIDTARLVLSVNNNYNNYILLILFTLKWQSTHT